MRYAQFARKTLPLPKDQIKNFLQKNSEAKPKKLTLDNLKIDRVYKYNAGTSQYHVRITQEATPFTFPQGYFVNVETGVIVAHNMNITESYCTQMTELT